MGENDVVEKSGLWFLSETEEGDEFKAEGRVSRIAGSLNRVQFNGTCILNNAPNRRLIMQGEATVNVARQQPSTAAEEQESQETVASMTVQDEMSESESEDQSEQILQELVERFGQRVASAVERGHVVEKRGGQFEEAEFQGEEGEQGFVTPENVGSPPLQEISPVRRGRINEEDHPSDVLNDDNDHVRDVDEDNAELVSPIRCVTMSTSGTDDEARDDEGVFTPIPVRIQSPDEEELRLARIDRNLALIFDTSNGDEEAAAQDQVQDSPDGQSMNTPQEITPERRPAKVTFKNTPQVRDITPRRRSPILKHEMEERELPTETESDSDDELEPSLDETETDTDSDEVFDIVLDDSSWSQPGMVQDELEEKTRMTVDMDAAKFTQAVIKTLLVRFLRYGASNAEMANRQRITHRDLAKVVRDQPEMNELLKDVVIPSKPQPPPQEE